MLISLVEYAQKHGKEVSGLRRKCIEGKFKTAQKIGRKLHEVSRGRQVICVTHLAQVAAFADHHLLISKNVLEGKTYTTVKPLTASDRVKELARIMGGDVVTSATLNAAEELLEKSK